MLTLDESVMIWWYRTVLKIRPQQHVLDNGWANGDFSKDGIHEIMLVRCQGLRVEVEMDNILTGIRL